MGALFILILISSILSIATFLWFRLARYPFSKSLFSVALLAGATSVFPALLLQNILAAGSGIFMLSGKWSLFAEIFIRIAFTEEFSRFLILLILFAIIRRIAGSMSVDSMSNAAGFIAGLGFAILESAVYGASNPDSALLRVFTAAPLHAVCGSRVGCSVALLRERPVHAIFRFLSAVVIHGAYDFMLNIPRRFAHIASVLIVITSLVSAVQAIRSEMRGQ